MTNPKRREAGFTLIEVMVVVTIVAIAAQIVTVNLGALVPSTLLDSESKKLMGTIDYLRSESQLRSETFKLEFDLDLNAYRIIFPEEMRLTSDQFIKEDLAIAWTGLDERVQFGGFSIAGGRTQRSGRFQISFDEHGYTADQVVFLKLNNEDMAEMVWTIQLRGLDRKTKLVTNQEGNEAFLTVTEEGAF